MYKEFITFNRFDQQQWNNLAKKPLGCCDPSTNGRLEATIVRFYLSVVGVTAATV